MIDQLDKDVIRRDRSALENALRECGCTHIRGNVARCPFHDDRNPSGSIHQAADGAWRFRCHKCDITEDAIGLIARKSGRRNGDVLRDLAGPSNPSPGGKVFPTVADFLNAFHGVEGHWEYRDPDTRAVQLIVVRFRQGGGKQYRQGRPCKGGFEFGGPPKPLPIYNRRQVREAQEIVVVEGEKCVHALHDLGIVATTSPGGAKNGAHADWSPLSGKRVILWADNDRVGREHMDQVAEILSRLPQPPDVWWVPVADLELPEGGDAVDYLANFDPAERQDAARLVLSRVEQKGGADELAQLIEDTLSGKMIPIDWPWEVVSDATQALLPGTVTCVCGDPNCGKSFLILEAAWRWHCEGVKVAVFELEEDRAFHLNRMLAQLAGESMLTKRKWMFENPDKTRQAHAECGPLIRTFQPRIWDAPDKPPRLPELGEWVQARASEGCRIIIVDPVTAATPADKQWIADQEFVMCCKAIARRHRCSVILATHPRMGKGGKLLDGMAGGAAYPRFSQTVLWLRTYDKPERVLMKNYQMQQKFTGEINRSIKVGKARSGPGSGWEIGFVFDPKTLRMVEQGIVIGEADE